MVCRVTRIDEELEGNHRDRVMFDHDDFETVRKRGAFKFREDDVRWRTDRGKARAIYIARVGLRFG